MARSCAGPMSSSTPTTRRSRRAGRWRRRSRNSDQAPTIRDGADRPTFDVGYTLKSDAKANLAAGPHRAHKQTSDLIDHLASAQQERSERVVDDLKCIRA